MLDVCAPKEPRRPTHPVPNHHALLARAFDVKHLNNGSIPAFDVPQHFLVDIQRVLSDFLEERGVGDGADVGAAVGECCCAPFVGFGFLIRRLGEGREGTFGDEVAAELLGGAGGDGSAGAVGLETETVGRRRVVEEHRIDPTSKS